MTRARESGAYLGGIGTMLGETRSCQACGGVHESHPYGFHHRGAGSCPAVVSDDFALLSRSNGETEDPELRFEELSVALPRSDLAIPFGPVHEPVTAPAEPPSRGLEVPWLRPPDLSGVL